jgi:hypothetical protein
MLVLIFAERCGRDGGQDSTDSRKKSCEAHPEDLLNLGFPPSHTF